MSQTEPLRRIGAVVLNYNSAEDTISCVQNLLGQSGISLHVVVVDNASADDFLRKIEAAFQDVSSVTVLPMKENVGFSRGNNAGIDWLRQNGYEMIWIANPDTLLTEPDILSTLAAEYEAHGYERIGVLNGKVLNKDGSPAYRIRYKKKCLYLRILKTFREAKKEYVSLRKQEAEQSLATERTFEPEKKSDSTNAVMNPEKVSNETQDNTPSVEHKTWKPAGDDTYAITGCAFLLTPAFFRSYEGLYPKLFLYGEETATMVLLHKAGLTTHTVETAEILHTGAGSTPEEMRKSKLRRMEIGAASNKAIVRLLLTPYRFVCNRVKD